MRTCNPRNRLTAMAGILLLLVGAACSKSIETDSGSKAMEQPPVKAKQDMPAPTVSGPDSSASSGPQIGSLPSETPAGAGGGKSGEERVAENMMVAKAESGAKSETASEAASAAQEEQMATAKAGLRDVFFAFDSWKLSEDGQKALAHDAEWLKANPEPKLAIEGYCDERGTQAYNMVLGQKRAKAVQSYLAELGIPNKRMTVVSYGKDKPFCREATEDCYQQNRRGHLVVTPK